MSKITVRHLETRRTARLAQIGESGDEIRHVWLVLHGYRQIVPFFVRKFMPIIDDNHWVVAPEALSRFYLDGYYGKVGASWMTREDREAEIADQIHYLNRVADMIREEAPGATLHLLGFSQGVATAWRWLMRGEVTPASLTIWTGRIPEDSDQTLVDRLTQMKLVHVAGDQDEFFEIDAYRAQAEAYRSKFPNLYTIEYSGGHDILPEPLARLRAHLEDS